MALVPWPHANYPWSEGQAAAAAAAREYRDPHESVHFGKSVRGRLWPLLLLCPLLLTPYAVVATVLSFALIAGALLSVHVAVSRGPGPAGRLVKTVSYVAGGGALLLVALVPSSLAPNTAERATQPVVSEAFRTAILAKISDQGPNPQTWGESSAEGPLRILDVTQGGWYLVSISGELGCVRTTAPVSFAARCPDEETLTQVG